VSREAQYAVLFAYVVASAFVFHVLEDCFAMNALAVFLTFCGYFAVGTIVQMFLPAIRRDVLSSYRNMFDFFKK
jgi:hypothetical protein